MYARTSANLGRRFREVREQMLGEDGGPCLAGSLGIPAQSWANYESGVTMPAEVALRFIVLTGVRPEWLLTGFGPVRTVEEVLR